MNEELKDLPLEGQVAIYNAKKFQELFMSYMNYIYKETGKIPTQEEENKSNQLLQELSIQWNKVPWLHKTFREKNKHAEKFFDILDNEYLCQQCLSQSEVCCCGY